MKDKEIELKFIITPTIKNKIIKDLDSLAIRESESRLIDTYYIPNFKNFEIDGITVECVRIRENDKGIILGYKKIHRECSPVYCDEYETIINNKEQMEKILLALGFSIQMVIDKTRLTYSLYNLEFDFDSVKGLGELLEVELKNTNDDINEIYEFVKKYGLTKENVTYEGIQNLMKKAIKND